LVIKNKGLYLGIIKKQTIINNKSKSIIMTTTQKNQIATNLRGLLITNPELTDLVNQTLTALSFEAFEQLFIDLVKNKAKKRFSGEPVEDFESWFIIFKTVFKVVQSEESMQQIKFLF